MVSLIQSKKTLSKSDSVRSCRHRKQAPCESIKKRLSIRSQTGVLPNPITSPLSPLPPTLQNFTLPFRRSRLHSPPHHQKGSSLELEDFQLPHPEELSLPVVPSSHTDLAESQSARRLYRMLLLLLLSRGCAMGYLWI